jgi:hypothetical protein
MYEHLGQKSVDYLPKNLPTNFCKYAFFILCTQSGPTLPGKNIDTPQYSFFQSSITVLKGSIRIRMKGEREAKPPSVHLFLS